MSDNNDKKDLTELTDEELVESLKKVFTERKHYYNLMTQAIFSTLINPRAAALLLLDKELVRLNLIDSNKDPREQYSISWDDCEIVRKYFEDKQKIEEQLVMYFTLVLNDDTPAAKTVGEELFLSIRLEIPVEHAFKPVEELVEYLENNVIFTEFTEAIAETIKLLSEGEMKTAIVDRGGNIYPNSTSNDKPDPMEFAKDLKHFASREIRGQESLTEEQKEKLKLAIKTGNYSKAKN